MIPIIIPAGATRDDVTEAFFGIKPTTQEKIILLRNIKKYIQKEIHKNYLNQEGGQPLTPTGEISRNVLGRFARWVAPKAEKVITRIPVLGDALAGAIGGYVRTGTIEGAAYGCITGTMIGVVKTAADTFVPGSSLAVDAVVLAIDTTVGYNAGGMAVTTRVATPTPTPTPIPRGGSQMKQFDEQYLEDYKNITNDFDQISAELKSLMGKKYYNEFMNKCLEIYKNKPVIRERVIELEDHILVTIYLFNYIALACEESSHKNYTRKFNNKKRNWNTLENPQELVNV